MYSTPAPTSFHALLAFIHTVKVKLVKEMDTPKAAVDHQAPVYDKDWLDQSLWEQPDLSTIRHWCMTRTDWSDQLLWEQPDLSTMGHWCTTRTQLLWEQPDLSTMGHWCMTRTDWSDQLLWEQPDLSIIGHWCMTRTDWSDQLLWEQSDLSIIGHWCMTRTDWSDQLLWEQSDLSIIGHCCMTRTRWSDQLLWEQPDWRYHWAVSCLISFQHNMLLSSDTQHLIAKKRSQHLLLSSDTAFDSHENHESHNDIPLPWQKLKADLISEAKTAPNTAHCVFFLVISDIIWWLIMYIIYIYISFFVYVIQTQT